jgi:murein DD-endopeptidase MepM/ murein hydrolase activator NlpD
MKKHNLAEFFKSKSFYALLCVGALAILAIAMVGLNQASENNKSNNLVDLNEPISDVAYGEDSSNQEIETEPDTNNTTSSTAANNEVGTSQTEVAQGNPDHLVDTDQAVTDGSLLEFDIYDDPQNVAKSDELKQEGTPTEKGLATDTATTQTAEAGETVVLPEKTTEPKQTASTVKPEEAQAVMKPETLNFELEDGLLWPVTGNILMNYSADRVIYYETLEQFKCNPAVIIEAEVGTEVLSSAKGIITDITQEDETGLTITASIGSGYSIVYGQLKDVKAEVGDSIDEGEVLGTVADPSKYYAIEGSNLYFQVLKEEDTMNPMLLLR